MDKITHRCIKLHKPSSSSCKHASEVLLGVLAARVAMHTGHFVIEVAIGQVLDSTKCRSNKSREGKSSESEATHVERLRHKTYAADQMWTARGLAGVYLRKMGCCATQMNRRPALC